MYDRNMKNGLDIKELERRAYILIKKSIKQRRRLEEIETRRRKGQLMMQILAILAIGISIPAVALIAPNAPIAVYYIRKIIRRLKTDKKGFIKSIKALKKQNLITIKHKGDNAVIEITEKGKKKILSYSIDLIQLPKKLKWDGYWRVIIFDIPNKLNQARRALSSTLRNLKCYQLQKSVYIYPFEIKDEIDFISSLFGVYEYIVYIKAKEIEGEEIVYEYFRSSGIL